MTYFLSLGSKITVDKDCSHKIKRHLLLGRKVTTNLDSVLKSRDITLLTKARVVKTMVFPVVKYGCDSWTIKKTECRRIDAFELWCWRTLKSPLDFKEVRPVNSLGNQPWIFTGWTLVIWYDELTHLKRTWCWERLKAKGEEGSRGWDGWTASLIQRT